MTTDAGMVHAAAKQGATVRKLSTKKTNAKTRRAWRQALVTRVDGWLAEISLVEPSFCFASLTSPPSALHTTWNAAAERGFAIDPLRPVPQTYVSAKGIAPYPSNAPLAGPSTSPCKLE